MALVYDALKTKWQKRQDTETVVFGATRDAVVTKLNRLVQTVRLPSFYLLYANFSNKE